MSDIAAEIAVLVEENREILGELKVLFPLASEVVDLLLAFGSTTNVDHLLYLQHQANDKLFLITRKLDNEKLAALQITVRNCVKFELLRISFLPPTNITSH